MTDISLNIETVKAIQLAMMRAGAPDKRGQHFKMNGCVDATFEVHPDIPEELKEGLFTNAASYRAVIRFSNGGETDDRNRDIHGMAIKLFDVTGRSVLESSADNCEQDFILADNPVFFIRTASDYAMFFEDFAKSAPQGKKPEKFIAYLQENHPQDLPVLQKFFHKNIQESPLASTYWSQVPYAFGTEGVICRYRVRPAVAPPSNGGVGSSPNYLRERMVERLSDGNDELVFDFDVQLKYGADKSVIDNPTVEWNEPFVAVASLRIAPQCFDTEERNQYGDDLSYTPWHAIEAHRPVGEVNEVRKVVYIASQELRHDAVAQGRE